MSDAIQAGGGVAGAMHALRPYIDRYVEANGEYQSRRQVFSKRLDRGEV
jgi:hypothetical protein